MESNRLKTKDIITVVLLSLINIVIFMSGTFLYATPVTLLLMPLYYALLEGMVVFTIGTRVRKRGAMLIYCAIQGIIGFYLPYTLAYILMGIVSEVILSKTGYGDSRGSQQVTSYSRWACALEALYILTFLPSRRRWKR